MTKADIQSRIDYLESEIRARAIDGGGTAGPGDFKQLEICRLALANLETQEWHARWAAFNPNHAEALKRLQSGGRAASPEGLRAEVTRLQAALTEAEAQWNAEVEHWVKRYNELEAWRVQTAQLKAAAEARVQALTAEREALRSQVEGLRTERHNLLILLDECRDAIQPLTTAQTKLYNISLTLARRIDNVIDAANEANKKAAPPPDAPAPTRTEETR